MLDFLKVFYKGSPWLAKNGLLENDKGRGCGSLLLFCTSCLMLLVIIQIPVGDHSTSMIKFLFSTTSARNLGPAYVPILTPTRPPATTETTSTSEQTETITPATPTAARSIGDMLERASDGMIMMYVPGGSFEMGSDYQATAYARKLCVEYSGELGSAICRSENFGDESPAHKVTLNGFWIDQTEVTNGQYQKCVRVGACTPPQNISSHTRTAYYGNADHANYPVIFVTREQASAYCNWTGGRLPTEAEWEYAARGPENWIFPWGDDFDGTRLNYCDLNCDAGPNDPSVDDGYEETAPVGSFPSGASWVGALDMAGNVREWVADWYGPYTFGPQFNPTGPDAGESIPHGGSWLDLPNLVRSANRGGNVPGYHRDYYGFRCVLRDRSNR